MTFQHKKIKWIFGKHIEIPRNWTSKRLYDIGKIFSGGTPCTKNLEYWNGEIFWATPTDITKLKTNYIINTAKTITKEGLKNSSAKLLPVNSILLTTRATIGASAITHVPISTNQGFQNIVCKPEYETKFIFYLLNQNYPSLLRVAKGTTFLEIGKNDLKNILLICPNLKHEQQKIASILSNVDALIESTQEVIDKHLKLKKGLLQKLLTKGINQKKFKTITSLFKKQIEIPYDWNVIKFQELFSLKKGKVPKSFSENPNNKSYVYLTMEFIRVNEIKFTDDPDVILVNKSDIVLIGDGAGSGRTYIGLEGALSSTFLLLVPRTTEIELKFMFNWLCSKYPILEATKFGTSIPHVDKHILNNYPVCLPSLSEQQKIASILSNIDAYLLLNIQLCCNTNLTTQKFLHKALLQSLQFFFVLLTFLNTCINIRQN